MAWSTLVQVHTPLTSLPLLPLTLRMRCKGCFKRFKNQPGLWKHLSQAHLAACRMIYLNHLNYLPSYGHGDYHARNTHPTVPDATDTPDPCEYLGLQSHKFVDLTTRQMFSRWTTPLATARVKMFPTQHLSPKNLSQRMSPRAWIPGWS